MDMCQDDRENEGHTRVHGSSLDACCCWLFSVSDIRAVLLRVRLVSVDYYSFWKLIMFAVIVIASVYVCTQIAIMIILNEIRKAIK